MTFDEFVCKPTDSLCMCLDGSDVKNVCIRGRDVGDECMCRNYVCALLPSCAQVVYAVPKLSFKCNKTIPFEVPFDVASRFDCIESTKVALDISVIVGLYRNGHCD